MAMAAANFCSFVRGPITSRAFTHVLQFSSACSSFLPNPLQESIRAAVESKTYHKIPDILNAAMPSSHQQSQSPNPFSFLSSLPGAHKARTVDKILQSFIPIRPRSGPRLAYSYLLSFTLEGPDPLPLGLAVLQRTLRSGCLPSPQTHLTLSKAWLDRRLLNKNHTASSMLTEMRSIGYSPDCGTCNYLVQSLCKVNKVEEAVEVVRAMGRAGCAPDLDSFGTLIGEMSEFRMSSGILKMFKEMVRGYGLSPRKEIVVKAANAIRANRDAWRGVEMVEFLEGENVDVGFEAYESVLECCLEAREFVLAGKFAVRMRGRGFIPYIRVRQRVFEGLVGVGEVELAMVVRRRFAEF
ncbi:Pentatricopeptide repeat-containing protein [Striga hermonthica]|uniref:Pentatricopeptide repeat-containing protein n=1 Tax=Striga hermonthica TaxID=68872 RepID=A0A9N7NDL7_STRHE|nr:Pentatricopeptide repeat-containing protein [Striga hermonthica]